MARVLETRKREGQPSPLDSGRVLVVERDKTLRSSFARSLGRRGLQVDTASSGAEAMELLQRHAYPVIVADPKLSAREGNSLVDELRSVRPDASFIITTDEVAADETCAADGGTCVLRKPWNERQLRTALDSASESYRIRQQSLSPHTPGAHAILLVDSDPASTQRVLSLLQRAGVARELQHCANAQDAVAVLRVRQFDAILLNDLSSAVAQLEALEQLRSAAPSAAVIALGERLQEGRSALRTRKSSRSKDAALSDDTQPIRKIILSGIERKQKEAEVDFLVQIDPLTQLLSQPAFGERLETCVSSSRRAKSRCSVMLVNLAKFSDLNRQHGHEAGDTVLCEIGRRIQASVREEDAVARLSADEYAVLLTHVEEPSVCVRVAERILGIAHLPVLLRDELEVQLRAHVGIAVYPDSSSSSDALLRHAHAALGRAKKERLDYVVHGSGDGPDRPAKRAG